MSQTEQNLAILIADICGSTALFEATGNLAATALIGSTLDRMAQVASDERGRIIRSKGDDLLCTFSEPTSAFEAATRMMALDFADQIEIHVGVHFGPVINTRGDVFGDPVNVAARLLGLANPREILVTQEVRDGLSPIDQRMLRLLDHRSIKGKAEPIPIYTLLPAAGDSTESHVEAGRHTVRAESVQTDYDPEFAVLITHGDRVYLRSESSGEFVLGRASTCDLIINEPCVSREHAIIWVRHGRAILIDRSSTGTFIMSDGEHPLLVVRETVPLPGSGVLSLGRSPKGDSPNLIHFKQAGNV